MTTEGPPLDRSGVLKRIDDRTILLVLGATLLLGVAFGIAVSLMALSLDARHFTKEAIGTLAAWSASGIVVFSLPVGVLVRRFTAKRVLTGATFGYAVGLMVFPFLTSYAAVAAARFCDGACSVGIWISCETMLLARAKSDEKARITSLYAICMAVGYIVGPLVARGVVAHGSLPVAFGLAGAIALGAGALVQGRLEATPTLSAHAMEAPTVQGATPSLGSSERHPSEEPSAGSPSGYDPPLPSLASDGWELLKRIRTSCFATFAYGYFQASVVLFLPLFLIESKGIAKEQTILIPAFFAAGMLLFSNTAGALGDRFGHLRTMRLLAAVGTTMVASFVYLPGFTLMSGAVFVAGATLAAISPVSLALQGMVVHPADLSRSNAIYNTFYAAGMLLGPPISSAFFVRFGGAGMLFHLAFLWTAFVLYTVLYFRDDPKARANQDSDPPPPSERGWSLGDGVPHPSPPT